MAARGALRPVSLRRCVGDRSLCRLGRNIFRGKSLGLFASLYAGAFAAMAVAITWRLRQGGARFGRIVLLFGLVVSVLPGFLPDSWLSFRAPVALRNPEKFAVLIVFALAVLSALAADRLEKAQARSRWLLAVGALLAVAGGRGCARSGARGPHRGGRSGSGSAREWIAAARLPNALAEAGLLWTLALVGAGLLISRRPAVRALALALVSLSPIAANRRIARTYRVDETFAPTPFARWVRRWIPRGNTECWGSLSS